MNRTEKMEMEQRKHYSNGMPDIPEQTFSSALYDEFARRSKNWCVEVDSLDFAQKLDKEDPLKEFRSRFYYPKKKYISEADKKNLTDEEEECIYFCGHSLGLQLKTVEHYLHDVLKNWAQRGVESHFDGYLPAAFCDLSLNENMAHLVGAESEEVAMMNGLTVNIYLMLSTFYQPTQQKYKILMVDNGFHSDLYAVQSHVKMRGYDSDDSIIFLKPRQGEYFINPKDIMSVIEEKGKEIALIFLEGVHFYTGQLFDMKNITKAGHKQGCIVGYDLAHAVGNVKLQLHDWNVDFALWCTYKYMNCGAGSLASIFVHNLHTDSSNGIIPMARGWWGVHNKKKFDFLKVFEPAEGADRFKLSNPSPFLAAMVMANLEVFREVGIDKLQEKQRLLSGYLEYLLKKNCHQIHNSDKPLLQIITPNDPKKRGCQISLLSSIPVSTFETMLKEKGIICDIRKPSVLRVTPVPLYNTFTEVYKFVQTLREILDNILQSEASTLPIKEEGKINEHVENLL